MCHHHAYRDVCHLSNTVQIHTIRLSISAKCMAQNLMVTEKLLILKSPNIHIVLKILDIDLKI